MTGMAITGFISIGFGQRMTLVADLKVSLLVIVVVYPAVRPVRSKGRFAARGSKVALVAF